MIRRLARYSDSAAGSGVSNFFTRAFASSSTGVPTGTKPLLLSDRSHHHTAPEIEDYLASLPKFAKLSKKELTKYAGDLATLLVEVCSNTNQPGKIAFAHLCKAVDEIGLPSSLNKEDTSAIIQRTEELMIEATRPRGVLTEFYKNKNPAFSPLSPHCTLRGLR